MTSFGLNTSLVKPSHNIVIEVKIVDLMWKTRIFDEISS